MPRLIPIKLKRPRMRVKILARAIQTPYPGACRETESLVHAGLAVNSKLLAETLIGEINDLPSTLGLVLDDYHPLDEPFQATRTKLRKAFGD